MTHLVMGIERGLRWMNGGFDVSPRQEELLNSETRRNWTNVKSGPDEGEALMRDSRVYTFEQQPKKISERVGR